MKGKTNISWKKNVYENLVPWFLGIIAKLLVRLWMSSSKTKPKLSRFVAFTFFYIFVIYVNQTALIDQILDKSNMSPTCVDDKMSLVVRSS